MVTSLDDLLTQAETQVWAAWSPIPSGEGGQEIARDRRDAAVGSWRALRGSAERVLVLTGDGHRLAPLLARLDRVVGPAAAATGVTLDPVQRAASLLGAAADALSRSDGPRHPDAAVENRTLSMLSFAATTTAAYVRLAGDSLAQQRLWLDLAQAARGARVNGEVISSAPSARPIIAPGDQTFAAALVRFHQAAWKALTPTASPSPDLQMIPAVLEMLHRAASSPGGTGPHADAARAWSAAARAWRPTIHTPGPPDHGLREAAGALRLATQRGMTRRDLADARRFGVDLAGDLAARYDTRVRDTIRSELPVIAARRLAEALRSLPSFDGLSPRLASAALRGRWVSLPHMSPPAWTIVSTTTAAAEVYRAGTGSNPGQRADNVRRPEPERRPAAPGPRRETPPR